MSDNTMVADLNLSPSRLFPGHEVASVRIAANRQTMVSPHDHRGQNALGVGPPWRAC